MECLVFSLFQMRIRLKQKTETNNTAKVNKSRIVQNRNYCQWIKINPENYNFHSLTFTGHFFYNSFKHLTFLFPRFFVVQISREPRAKKGHKGSVCIVLYMQSKKVTTTSTTLEQPGHGECAIANIVAQCNRFELTRFFWRWRRFRCYVYPIETGSIGPERPFFAISLLVSCKSMVGWSMQSNTYSVEVIGGGPRCRRSNG